MATLSGESAASGGLENARRWAIALAAVGVAGVVQALVLLLRWVRFDVSEDQALLWAAADAWGDLQPRQPHFWGQRYGVTLEAIPAEFLRLIGVGYPTGLPLGVLAMNLAAWGVLAAAAWRRARPAWAIAALAVPLVLPLEYVVLSMVFNTAFGRLLGCLCAAIVILWTGRRRPFAAALSLGGLSVLFDTASALIVLPALAVGLCELVAVVRREGGVGATLGAIGVGALAPIVWYAFADHWYRVHPDDDLHPVPSLSPELDILRDNLSNSSRHFTTYSLELARSPIVGLLLVALILGYAVSRADHRARLAAGVVLVLLAAALSLPRSRDYLPTPYYPAARVLMPLPMALWFVAFTTSTSARRSWPPAARRYGFVTLTVLVGVSAVVRVATWSERAGGLRNTAEAYPNYPLWSSSDVVGLCDQVGRLAAAYHVEHAMFEYRTHAYACAPLLDGVTTFYPPYDRRSWTLREVAAARPDTMFIVGRTPIACSEVAELSCELLAPDIAIAGLGGIGPLEAADRLGVVIRPFERS